MLLPKLRPVEASPVQDDGKTYLALRDQEGFSDRVVLLSRVDAMIAAHLDGRATAEDVAAAVAKFCGSPVPLARIAELVRVLDESRMLESEAFLRHKQSFVDAYRGSPERPPFLAGRAYEPEPKALAKAFAGYFRLPGAPGRPPRRAGKRRLTGLVAPHIDYERGKLGYAWAYREIFRSGLADLYVIIGVAHATPPTPLVLTDKDFGTPFGPAAADRALAGKLSAANPFDLRADELTHRTEHSVEFQAVYLKYAQDKLGGEFKILPLLASSCDLEGSEPGRRTHVALELLCALLRDYPGRVCLLAGVDLAHVGPCFGDEEAVTPEDLERVRIQDEASLERVLAQDPKGFLDSVMQDGNARRVCGVSALYAFSWLHKRLFPDSQGELLHYGHAADPTGGEVSFASAAFRC